MTSETPDTPSTEAREWEPPTPEALLRSFRAEGWNSDEWGSLVDDVIADAERAVRQEAADTSGLPHLLDNANPNKVALWQRNKGWLTDDEAEAVIRTALEGATERPLDVTRLARAMFATHPLMYPQSWPDDNPDDIGPDPLTDARNIAAEYARLASPTTTEEA